MIELVLGGARSGKSRYAEQLAERGGRQKYYLATADAQHNQMDEEMKARITAHQRRRDASWRTIEEPLALADSLQRHAADGRCIVVDCLTLWLTNLLAASAERRRREKDQLLAALPGLGGDIIFISNEVGSGIVPIDALSRRFVDEAGWLHQDIAKRSDKVTLLIAGLAQHIKDAGA